MGVDVDKGGAEQKVERQLRGIGATQQSIAQGIDVEAIKQKGSPSANISISVMVLIKKQK